MPGLSTWTRTLIHNSNKKQHVANIYNSQTHIAIYHNITENKEEEPTKQLQNQQTISCNCQLQATTATCYSVMFVYFLQKKAVFSKKFCVVLFCFFLRNSVHFFGSSVHFFGSSVHFLRSSVHFFWELRSFLRS